MLAPHPRPNMKVASELRRKSKKCKTNRPNPQTPVPGILCPNNNRTNRIPYSDTPASTRDFASPSRSKTATTTKQTTQALYVPPTTIHDFASPPPFLRPTTYDLPLQWL